MAPAVYCWPQRSLVNVAHLRRYYKRNHFHVTSLLDGLYKNNRSAKTTSGEDGDCSFTLSSGCYHTLAARSPARCPGWSRTPYSTQTPPTAAWACKGKKSIQIAQVKNEQKSITRDDICFTKVPRDGTDLFMYFIIKSNFSRSLSSISSVQYFTTCRMSSSIGSNKRQTHVRNQKDKPKLSVLWSMYQLWWWPIPAAVSWCLSGQRLRPALEQD